MIQLNWPVRPLLEEVTRLLLHLVAPCRSGITCVVGLLERCLSTQPIIMENYKPKCGQKTKVKEVIGYAQNCS